MSSKKLNNAFLNIRIKDGRKWKRIIMCSTLKHVNMLNKRDLCRLRTAAWDVDWTQKDNKCIRLHSININFLHHFIKIRCIRSKTMRKFSFKWVKLRKCYCCVLRIEGKSKNTKIKWFIIILSFFMSWFTNLIIQHHYFLFSFKMYCCC